MISQRITLHFLLLCLHPINIDIFYILSRIIFCLLIKDSILSKLVFMFLGLSSKCCNDVEDARMCRRLLNSGSKRYCVYPLNAQVYTNGKPSIWCNALSQSHFPIGDFPKVSC